MDKNFSHKTLILVVSSFPYGFGEPYLDVEIVHLSKSFDKIYILVCEYKIGGSSMHLSVLPPNVEVIPFYQKVNLWLKFLSVKYILSSVFYEELKIIKKDFNSNITIGILKTLLIALIRGDNFSKKLEKFIISKNIFISQCYIYTYWCTRFTFGVARLKQKYPLLTIFTRTHGWDVYFERNAYNYLPLRSCIFNNINAVFTISVHGKNYLTEKIPFADKNKIIVSRLGAKPLGTTDFVRDKNKIRILTIAFLNKNKRVDLLIDALSGISEIEIEWHHIGRGEEKEKIHEFAHAKLSGKSNILYQFLGAMDNKSVYEYMQQKHFDLFINTSESEGIPVSMMEAMSFGIPVIGTDVGGVSEIIKHNINGFLLPANPTVEEISAYIKNFCLMDDEKIFLFRKNAHNTWDEDYNADKNYPWFTEKILSLPSRVEPSASTARAYQACTKCIYDTADYSEIYFDEKGVCNICSAYDDLYSRTVIAGENGEKKLLTILEEIKRHGKGKEYDCIIGISGGVDSTYLAYKAKQWGLNPLMVHVDNGWNTESAVKNIEHIVKKLDLDLHTDVINWEEIRDLQLAYLKASVIDIDVPADNTFVASLYHTAKEKKIKYILSGYNTVTEGWMPQSHSYNKYDTINLRAIHKRFGSIPLKTFPTTSKFTLFYYHKVLGIKAISPLNYIEYNKDASKKILMNELGWHDYGGKHYENIFTRFYQGYILPVKFGFDKRKSHYSTLICSGQMTRENALEEIKKPAYDSALLQIDREIFIKKLGLTDTEFEKIMRLPVRKHTDYPSYMNIYRKLKPFHNVIKKVKKIISA